MADITLAPTDNWQAAFRDFDGYGNITLHGGQEYNAVGGITFKAPRANIRSNGPTPPKINGYWSVENTSLTLRNIDYTPPPGSMLFYIRGGRLALMDPKVTIPPEYPQIKSLASINEAGSVLDCNQGLREQGGRIRASQSKVIFAGNNTDRIIVPVDAI